MLKKDRNPANSTDKIFRLHCGDLEKIVLYPVRIIYLLAGCFLIAGMVSSERDGPAQHRTAFTSDITELHPSSVKGKAFSIARYQKLVIDSTTQFNSHKPKVMAKFSPDGFNDLGSLDNEGFKLYRYTRNWKPYIIFRPGNSIGFEDAAVADINHDGWNDIVLGGWSNKTIWAANPEGVGKDPYTNSWNIQVVDQNRFSHEVCTGELNNDGKADIITTSGIYFQGATPASWTFVQIGRSGQGTCLADVLNDDDGFSDVIALYRKGAKNEIAWFENPGHSGGDPLTGKWIARIIDEDPGGDRCNFEMTTMAFTAGDVNGDGRSDLVCASQGEGPGAGDDSRQIGDGLTWYQAPKDPRHGKWIKHVVDSTIGWVHASSIKLADFNGDGYMDINYGQQDQSKDRKDGSPARQELGIFYNKDGHGTAWHHQVLIRYPEYGAGGFNSKTGLIGQDPLPSIFTSLHGYFKDKNPLILWHYEGKKRTHGYR